MSILYTLEDSLSTFKSRSLLSLATSRTLGVQMTGTFGHSGQKRGVVLA